MTEPGPTISIVIPARNAARYLGELLDTLERQLPPTGVEILLADNGSEDATVEIATRYADRLPLKIIDASDRVGAAHARNLAATHASMEFLAFADADDLVADDWYERLSAALATHDFVAARLEYHRLNTEAQLRARGLRQPDGLLKSFGDRFPYSGSGTLAVRRSLHEAVGGFDEEFWRGGEDPDYCWRVEALGARLAYDPRVVVHYRYRAATRGMFRQSFNYGMFRTQLLGKHRDLGLWKPPRQLRKAARAWARIVVRAPLIVRNRARRPQWGWNAGLHLGLLVGSARNRVLYLTTIGLPPADDPSVANPEEPGPEDTA